MHIEHRFDFPLTDAAGREYALVEDLRAEVQFDSGGWYVTADDISCRVSVKCADGTWEYADSRPLPQIAEAAAWYLTTAPDARRRIDDAIRDAGGLDALHERARAGQVMKRAAEG